MLVHQTQDSEGTVAASVKVTDRNVVGVRETGTCHSGIRLALDGVLSTIQANGGFSAISGEWLVTGAASGFFVQRTIISGTLEVHPGAGFFQLNVTRDYHNQHRIVNEGGWHIADAVKRSYDVEGMHVGTIAA